MATKSLILRTTPLIQAGLVWKASAVDFDKTGFGDFSLDDFDDGFGGADLGWNWPDYTYGGSSGSGSGKGGSTSGSNSNSKHSKGTGIANDLDPIAGASKKGQERKETAYQNFGATGAGAGAGGSSKDLYGTKGTYGGYGSSAYGAGAYGYGGSYGGSLYGDRGYDSLYANYGHKGGSKGSKTPPDECAKLETEGVQVVDLLKEVASKLFENSTEVTLEDDVQGRVEKLLVLLTEMPDDRMRSAVLSSCPQAVALAWLLRSILDINLPDGLSTVVSRLQEALDAAARSKPSLYSQQPQWTGAPWEPILFSAQQRSGVLMLPLEEQQFEVHTVNLSNWTPHPGRRCRGRRDLGNFQALPLAECLAKCDSHPLCRSALFYRWQPGFENRCFLSSTCTGAMAQAEGGEHAVLLERRHVSPLSSQDSLMQRSVASSLSGAPWSPRFGHRMVFTPGRKGEPNGSFWLMGGAGVTPPHLETATASSSSSSSASGGSETGSPAARASTKKAAVKRAGSTNRWTNQSIAKSDIIEAYLSRHVELNADLPPLRSLPYGRLGDMWTSRDLAWSWTQESFGVNASQSSSPWGKRSFFGLISLPTSRAMVLIGGATDISSNSVSEEDAAIGGPMKRKYTNDVWWMDLETGKWMQLADAPFDPRASFQVVLLADHLGVSKSGRDAIMILGGRLENGTLVNDVWVAEASTDSGSPILTWTERLRSAPWGPRSDFAAATRSWSDIFIAGGSDQEGRPLSDVWRSLDRGQHWTLQTTHPGWGFRIGASLLCLPPSGPGKARPFLLFGGFQYPNASNSPLQAPPQKATLWGSLDGSSWRPLLEPHLAWIPNRMHSSAVLAPCNLSSSSSSSSASSANSSSTTSSTSTSASSSSSSPALACIYVAGGLTEEGYYDNTVYRLSITKQSLSRLAEPWSPKHSNHVELSNQVPKEKSWGSLPPLVAGVALAVFAPAIPVVLAAYVVWGIQKRKEKKKELAEAVVEEPPPKLPEIPPLAPDPHTKRRRHAVAAAAACLGLLVLGGIITFWKLFQEVRLLRETPPRCRPEHTDIPAFRALLGLPTSPDRWETQTLVRLASKEPSGLGGYGDSLWRGGGGAGYRDRYDDYLYGSYGGYGSGYGSYGSGYDSIYGPREQAKTPTLVDELKLLPTTQTLSCRTPRCDRNESNCAPGANRSWSSPYGCCNDYMLLMLSDITEWLNEHSIPYFITYGTLLGSLRDADILPWTQDMDIVVDRRYWPQLQRSLEASDFFGGRRYAFGVDQWEERVSRICADWEGFSPSIIGGDSADRLTRATDFYLDVYASDWWQITELHMADCVEPLGSMQLPIRGLNVSAPARPWACVEKLYGADWRVPKKALSGVN